MVLDVNAVDGFEIRQSSSGLGNIAFFHRFQVQQVVQYWTMDDQLNFFQGADLN